MGLFPLLEIMKEEQGGGCILNTEFHGEHLQPAGSVAYPASKCAVNGLTWSLAREAGPFHIRVDAGASRNHEKTDMVAATLPKEMIEPLVNPDSVTKVGEAEDIANAFFVSTPVRWHLMSRAVLSVDGAMRAHGYALRRRE